jgi:hypothetical protein
MSRLLLVTTSRVTYFTGTFGDQFIDAAAIPEAMLQLGDNRTYGIVGRLKAGSMWTISINDPYNRARPLYFHPGIPDHPRPDDPCCLPDQCRAVQRSDLNAVVLIPRELHDEFAAACTAAGITVTSFHSDKPLPWETEGGGTK